MSTHYTAVIEVIKRTKEAREIDQYNRIKTEATDDKREVAKIVIRADTLEALVKKAKSHIDLISE